MQAVALIHEDEGVFGVSFPDFPGATTVGNSPDEAIAKAAQMLAFHVEGLAEDGPLPTPRSLAQLQDDADFVADAKGAAVAFIPYSPPTKAVRVNVTLDEGLLSRVDQAATARGETRSGFLANAARARMMEDLGFQTQVGEMQAPQRKRA